MATVLHSESSRLYSWWWDSHISPKNSRWLQENLTDMDLKVKAMIKLIEEDADSFARRAEMYYKKRPELMKLVEEFYRAYRALAERYDHATVELRQAHRTMAEAFPNQVPFMLAECSPSGSSLSGSEPQTPEMLHIKRSLLDPDDFHKDALGLSLLDLHAIKRNETFTDQSDSGLGKKGLKQLKLMLGSAEIPSNSELAEVGVSEVLIPAEDERERSLLDAYFLSSEENSNLKTEILSERDDKTKSIVENLKEALGKIKAEKQVLFLQYQQNLERLACLDKELNYAQNDAKTLNERAFKAETEVKTLREALDTLEAERDAGLIEHNQSLEKIANLETMVSQAHRDATGLIERATKAETEVRNLKLELSRVEAEKEAALLQYKLCLEKLATLEDKILHAENDAKKLIDQTDRAENEVRLLRQALTESREEKETLAVLHKQCQATISELERETRRSQEDAKRLNSELLTGLEKLKYAEEQFRKLESLNQSLQLEVENLAKKMVMKDQELLQKHEELEKLQFCVQNEHSRLLQVEATLQTLQQLHSKSQEDHQALVSEVKNGLQLLKDSEKYKQDLEREIQRVNKENRGLNDLNLSSTILIRDMQNEAYNLRKTKGKLEEKVAEQLDQIKALQRDIYHLKEEIKGLNRRYQALVEQLELVGLNPDSVLSSVKSLQDENLQLEESWKRDRDEKEVLLKKVEDMGLLLEKKAVLESSLSDVTGKLEEAREKVKSFQESYQILLGEKSILVAEKSALFSQLQIVTENMQKLLQKNSCLEDSFSAASAELEGLRTKSKSLEESCHLLSNEKSNLLNEREKLVAQLEIVEQRLENLEKRFAVLEEKYAGMEKEKEHTLHQVEELQASLGLEKQERTNFMQSSEARLVGLENHIYLLQEESKSRRKEFEEELDKAVNAQVEIFILQRLLQDMEENNLCLLIECQKYKEAYELSEKLISELEGDNLEQQVELEFVLDEIKVLKGGIYSMIMALESDQANGCKNETETEQISQISRSIEHMKSSILRIEDEKLQLLVENSVIYTLFEELRLEGKKLKSENEIIKLNFKSFKEQFAALLCEKSTLVVENGQLMLEISESDHREEVRKAEVERLLQKLVDLQHNYNELERGKFKANEENASLLKDYLKLEEEKCLLEEENYSIFQEAISCNNLSFYYSCFGTEKVAELEALADDLDNLQCINSDLKMEVELLGKKLELKETENSDLKESVEMLEEKSNQFQLWEVEAASFYFDLQISTVREVLYENKVQDLTIVCENLEDESALKNAELELIKERVGYLEGEVGRLNTELSAYNPIICSLRDNIVSLEQNALFRIKHNGESYQELRDVEVDVDLHGDDYESQEDRTAVVSDKISDLQNMQERIEAVEKAVIQGMEELAKQESINTNAKLEAAMKEIEELRSENRFYQQKLSLQGRAHGDEMQGDFDLQKTEPGRNWVLMKDIPLDRVSNCSFHGITRVNTVGSDDPMLVLWETADQDHRRDPSVHDTQKEASLAIDGDIVLDQTEDIEQKSGHASSEVQLEKELSVDKLEVPTRVAPSYEYVNKRNVLERVASDSQRLHTLQSTVQELKKKMEANKKTKKGKNSEYVTIEEQLQETEEAVAELVEINAQLTKDIEELEDDASTGLEDTGNAQRQDVLEQAQKGSEKIGRLQLEVQKIQYILLKLKDEKKSKGTSRFPNNRISKASGLFRSFAYSGGKKKKGCFCGGSRPSSPGGDHGKHI